MEDRKIESFSMIIVGIIVFFSGAIVAYARSSLVLTIIQMIAIVLVFFGVSQLVLMIIQKKEKHDKLSLGSALISIALGLGLDIAPNVPMSIMVILFGGYLLINAVIKLITYRTYKNNKVGGRLILLIDAIIFLIFGLVFITSPSSNVERLFLVVGLYMCCLGYTFIRDGLDIVVPRSYKDKISRRIRINLPIFMVALLPYRALQKFNKLIAVNEEETDYYHEGNEEYDLEIMIHVTNSGYGALGHVDLCFEGNVISYGNYDADSWKLFETLGEGVLFIAPKDKYIPFCIKHSQKTLFGYGIKLTDKQYQNVKNKIEDIKSRVELWEPPVLKDMDHQEKYTDYSSILTLETGAKMFKFKKGRFKTYFVMSTNCVLLADSVLGRTGTDLLNINGVISPGTYYDYFDKEYRKKDSFVVSKTIYK